MITLIIFPLIYDAKGMQKLIRGEIFNYSVSRTSLLRQLFCCFKHISKINGINELLGVITTVSPGVNGIFCTDFRTFYEMNIS